MQFFAGSSVQPDQPRRSDIDFSLFDEDDDDFVFPNGQPFRSRDARRTATSTQRSHNGKRSIGFYSPYSMILNS